MALEGVTGISAAFGFATEAETWGTSVAPAKWLPFMPGESLSRQQTFIRSSAIRAGRMFTLGGLTTGTTRGAGGNISFEVGNKGFGQFLNLLGGETEASLKPVKEAGGAYKQIHKIGTADPYKKSLTLVKAAPKTEGGVVPSYCYPGSILSQLELSVAASGFLVANATVSAKDENQEQTIGTVSYPSGLESFNFTQCVVKVATVEQKFIRSFKLTFAKPTDDSRFFLGTATRAQPLTNGFNTIKLDLETDFNNDTLYKKFEKIETAAVEITFTGAVAAGSEKFELKLAMPVARFEGDSPNVSDLGPLKQTIPLMIEDNGSEAPLTATYVSTDIAL